MKEASPTAWLGSALLGVAPASALAHGGELVFLGVAQFMLGVVAACVLVPLRIERRRKLGALVGFVVGIPLGWMAASFLPVSMLSVFVAPFALPLLLFGLCLFALRPRASQHGQRA